MRSSRGVSIIALPIAAEVAVTKIVGENQHDIWRPLFGRRSKKASHNLVVAIQAMMSKTIRADGGKRESYRQTSNRFSGASMRYIIT